jgi:hypothetical protein
MPTEVSTTQDEVRRLVRVQETKRVAEVVDLAKDPTPGGPLAMSTTELERDKASAGR